MSRTLQCNVCYLVCHLGPSNHAWEIVLGVSAAAAVAYVRQGTIFGKQALPGVLVSAGATWRCEHGLGKEESMLRRSWLWPCKSLILGLKVFNLVDCG
jgi:hypothetical protein